MNKLKRVLLNPDSSISIGSILGISIDIHLSWIVIFFLISYSLSTSYYFNYLSVFGAWIFGIISTLFLFSSIVAHELSHSYFAMKSGVDVKRIILFMFGGVANIKTEPPTPRSEFIIAISGPICSFTIAILSGALFIIITLRQILLFGFGSILDFALMAQLHKVLPTLAPFAALLFYLTMVNLLLGLFNLIPAFPMDGGRVLRALIWHKTKDILKSTKISSFIAISISIIIAILGGYLLWEKYFIVGTWNIIIAFFLFRTAKNSYKRLLYRRNLLAYE